MVRLSRYVGQFLTENKHLSQDSSIEKLPLPQKVSIPLAQHLGKICHPQVKSGDHVRLGQVIASVEARVTALIHSSVSGEVISIEDCPHPVLGKCRAIILKNDREEGRGNKEVKHKHDVEKLNVGQLQEIIFNAGIVGMGGAGFPTHIKLTPPKPVSILIVNGAECEPYLTADYRLMLEKTSEIIEGARIAKKCLGAEKIIVAIEDNKPQAIKKFQELNSDFEVRILPSGYPQGGEKQLIKNVLGIEVIRGKLPFDMGVGVQNVATLFAIYEAVYLNKPLYERVVTVTGSCITHPKNILAPIGAPIQDLIDFCSPLKENPAKIIIGGPMMGIAQFTAQTPIIKTTTGIVLLAKDEIQDFEEEFCIRCGACVRGCPAGLMPTMINLASRKEMWQEAKFYGANDCIECGLCSYLCPSRIKLVQSIRRAKMELVK